MNLEDTHNKVKITMEFTKPDNDYELKWALAGEDLRWILYDVDNKLRDYLKYGNDFKSADEALESIRDYVWGCANDRNINFMED